MLTSYTVAHVGYSLGLIGLTRKSRFVPRNAQAYMEGSKHANHPMSSFSNQIATSDCAIKYSVTMLRPISARHTIRQPFNTCKLDTSSPYLFCLSKSALTGGCMCSTCILRSMPSSEMYTSMNLLPPIWRHTPSVTIGCCLSRTHRYSRKLPSYSRQADTLLAGSIIDCRSYSPIWGTHV